MYILGLTGLAEITFGLILIQCTDGDNWETINGSDIVAARGLLIIAIGAKLKIIMT
jgi:hypothetical protein